VTNLDPVVVTVAELSRLRAVIYPPTELAQTLSVDAVVGLRLEDGQSVDVTVDFVSPVTDADSRTVRTELVLENPKGKFRSGARCWLGIQPTTKVEQNSGLTDVRGVSAFSTKDLK
jgi:multidrug efflux pump subunit AcrA (membrane-fusion protein)